jgi:cell division protein FtsW
VAVSSIPVTGQTLPLVVAVELQVWMTCIALGIIISVTKKKRNYSGIKKCDQKERGTSKLIDRELQVEV